jgi:hypothetical protein
MQINISIVLAPLDSHTASATACVCTYLWWCTATTSLSPCWRTCTDHTGPLLGMDEPPNNRVAYISSRSTYIDIINRVYSIQLCPLTRQEIELIELRQKMTETFGLSFSCIILDHYAKLIITVGLESHHCQNSSRKRIIGIDTVIIGTTLSGQSIGR